MASQTAELRMAASSGAATPAPATDSAAPPAPAEVKRRRGRPPGVHLCQVCRCNVTSLGGFYKRYHICREHAAVSELEWEGVPSRFCQQCGCFHPLSSFQDAQRSCREQLAFHAARRRQRRLMRRQSTSLTTLTNAASMLPGASGATTVSGGAGTTTTGGEHSGLPSQPSISPCSPPRKACEGASSQPSPPPQPQTRDWPHRISADSADLSLTPLKSGADSGRSSVELSPEGPQSASGPLPAPPSLQPSIQLAAAPSVAAPAPPAPASDGGASPPAAAARIYSPMPKRPAPLPLAQLVASESMKRARLSPVTPAEQQGMLGLVQLAQQQLPPAAAPAPQLAAQPALLAQPVAAPALVQPLAQPAALWQAAALGAAPLPAVQLQALAALQDHASMAAALSLQRQVLPLGGLALQQDAMVQQLYLQMLAGQPLQAAVMRPQPCRPGSSWQAHCCHLALLLHLASAQQQQAGAPAGAPPGRAAFGSSAFAPVPSMAPPSPTKARA